MVDSTIKTGVDRLIELLKKEDKISISEVAKKLKIPIKILQTWVDFLIEEKVLSIEYKFTQPYIYLNKEEKQTTKSSKKITIPGIKQQFFNRAKKKNLTEEQTRKLWQRKLVTELEKQKEYFYTYAKAKKIENISAEWDDFCTKVKVVG